MKNTKLYTLSLLILLTIGLTSCFNRFDCVRANAPIQEEVRELPAFTSVDHRFSGDVHIMQGNEQSVIVKGAANILPQVRTFVDGESLYIDIQGCVTNLGSLDIYVTMPEIRGVQVAASGNIYGQNTWSVDQIDLNILGSGNIQASIEGEEVRTNIEGSGDIELSGTCTNHLANINASGKIESFDLISNTCEVSIDGSGVCQVHVLDSLDVSITASGDVYYKGNPIVNSHISGSGKIKHVE